MSDLKIVQLLPMPDNYMYQGALWGLGSDGVTYEYKGGEWVAIVPNLTTPSVCSCSESGEVFNCEPIGD